MNQFSQPALRCVEESPSFIRVHFDADPVAAAQMRSDLRDWLAHHFAPEDGRVNDVLLAVYEATANVVEFAYLEFESGTVEVSAIRECDRLTVTVIDYGKWRGPTMDPQYPSPTRIRGRGIPLMKSLADEAKIHTSNTGTRVHLMWTGLR